MRKIFLPPCIMLPLAVIIFFSSCKSYYLAQSNEAVAFRESIYTPDSYYIQPAEYFIVEKNSLKYLYLIEHGEKRGYLKRSTPIRKLKSISKKSYYKKHGHTFASFNRNRRPEVYAAPRQSTGSGSGITSSRTPSTPSTSSSQSSYSPPARSTGGSVQVKGYYRKDGTYVRPHTRSAPKRRN